MSHDDITIIARSVESTNVWLKELAGELGVEDRNDAYAALRGVLHALRDHLTVDETTPTGGATAHAGPRHLLRGLEPRGQVVRRPGRARVPA
ncbi:DUF2267 domain-containing protein [Baekduia soli]|uniref:DUF2267 domain-containing protein n=1 Tax=Baekduia soli TaxID=496014 RepID=UPI00225DD155|nr:DUF2267 domain-containing protein [Baekduia soli]